jgi:hypothetical protein
MRLESRIASEPYLPEPTRSPPVPGQRAQRCQANASAAASISKESTLDVWGIWVVIDDLGLVHSKFRASLASKGYDTTIILVDF